MRRSSYWNLAGAGLVVSTLAACVPAGAQEFDEDSPFRPGLIATFAAHDQSVTRLDEVVAFDWQDAAGDSRLPAGEFTATWRGRLWTKTPGNYQLHCYAQGEVTIRLAGQTAITGNAVQTQWLQSQPLALDFDYHELEITYRRTQPRGELAVFWTGPDFQLEPVPARALWHERERSPSRDFERGRQLATTLRCAACHADKAADVTPAPALERLAGNIRPSWIVDWLSKHEAGTDTKDTSKNAGRMPDLGLSRSEAEAVAAWLVREPAQRSSQKELKARQGEQKGTKETKREQATKKADGKSSKKAREEKPKPSAAEGERLVLTRGCLACHSLGQFGESGLLGGGDLTNVFAKRPADFLTRWLADPAAINRHHRMPQFTFTSDELTSLKLWAEQTSGTLAPASEAKDKAPSTALVRDGEKLIASLRCAACHALTEKSEPLVPSQKELSSASDWSHSCTAAPARDRGRPGYRLAAEDQAALKAYFSQSRPGTGKESPQARGRDLLGQLNCLACHHREGIAQFSARPLQEKLTALAQSHGDLAPLVPAMTPPALNSVGDKLHDAALADAISRTGPPHRPYLLVQMPKFALTKEQQTSLVAYFTATDRIPGGIGVSPVLTSRAGETPTPQALAAAGPRLVTTDGLSCTSCHAVGSVQPVKAPLNARGPDLSQLDKRIRREWFDRWCADPARIVPRMEMPSVKVPVRGVLNENVEHQLAAVWRILNTPGFEPPEPNPVRVLRLSGLSEKNERPIFIRDVIKEGDDTYFFPLAIGLPNRHNVLFDLERFRLAGWWLGDVARQRTKGKTWYWEAGGKPLFDAGLQETDVSFIFSGQERRPQGAPQFAARLDKYGLSAYRDGSLGPEPQLNGWLSVPISPVAENESGQVTPVAFSIFLQPMPRAARQIGVRLPGLQEEATVEMRALAPPPGMTGFAVTRYFRGRQKDPLDEVRLRLVSSQVAAKSQWDESTATLTLPGGSTFVRLPAVPTGRLRWNGDGSVSATPRPSAGSMWSANLYCEYFTSLPVDAYLADPPPVVPVVSADVAIAPGIAGRRLPLPDEIMPSGLSWTPEGNLVFATLKGQVYSALDSDGDGKEDKLQLLADGQATPYGISAYASSAIDVIAKDGLLRLVIAAENGPATRVETLASGWGMTDDYHDWAVGLISGEGGEYYVALPCQQDQRTAAAATLRGKLLKLMPRRPQFEDPRLFDIAAISAGHRFPMGLARNREGELFVTDNQGNYNPFNELNHVRKGAHFGFINALEKQNGFQPPPLTEPAINIPHPWTRSVNGICFLDTPTPALKSPSLPLSPSPPRSLYGPLEGHLIGCEYDTRRLIRMSLQKIGDTYQGCAYPLSIPPADVEKGLLGPIVCAIKPTTGELYVGEIRDSGWGAANNIGQIVKIKIEPDKLPCGIAEVRATKTGFTIDFFQPVERTKAADAASYAIESYRRESTPAYGGPDIDRRTEKVSGAAVSDDGKRVTLTLPGLRAGHNYELRLKNLAPGGGVFHPDEAHYTLRWIPD